MRIGARDDQIESRSST